LAQVIRAGREFTLVDLRRHAHGRGHPDVVAAKRKNRNWIPACAGKTAKE
jgi:hypothetical protein